ncbi:hypothetical protein H8S90_14265 [Olivibacter sp. SDN3]|uniref:hypothetical protein n=1 Tax=Olivibacter sp. SDN3 TaxID=2764720 RepID=UPI001650FCD0|nr:hypothetical protein [Olivibacter sp. SDN3]QNL47975.1 hypothetical protein H8S90_14265 [Olivibacter sp. SDN3]
MNSDKIMELNEHNVEQKNVGIQSIDGITASRIHLRDTLSLIEINKDLYQPENEF